MIDMVSSVSRKPTEVIRSKFKVAIVLALSIALTVFNCGRAADADPNSPRHLTLESVKGYWLSGSGQWRTPNRDYEPGGDQPKEFGLDYRWGPHKQHIIGELIGVGEKGKAVYATIYIKFNPVTEQVLVDLINWDGTYGPAVERRVDNTHHVIESIFYGADGSTNVNRHTYQILDANSYLARSYGKSESGAWKLEREETWRRIPQISESLE